jgi:glyoxylase-like metal-dependent hydrolase (beta-lactamase superfamily II)
MQEIAQNVYIDSQYPGVTLGAVNLPHGLIQIDAPPSAEDARVWRAALLNLGGGVERVLINLDAHPDRTLGVRAMDCTVIAHEKTAQVFRNRPNAFKAQGEETGADWEQMAGLGSIRWAPPEIIFTQQMAINWSNTPVVLEHHPGPSAGAIWAILPNQKVIFIGDAILKGQPPFLASANLPMWIVSLETLLSSEYANWLVVSGRGGLVAESVIQSQLGMLKQLNDDLDKLAAKQAPVDETRALIPPILAGLRVPAAKQSQYTQRLRYGLAHYYARHYHAASLGDEEEE